MEDNKKLLPVAVVGDGSGDTARLLRRLTPYPVVELTPCQVVMGGEEMYRAVVVENYQPRDQRTLSGCAAARWELARRSQVTVVALDDPEGRRLAQAMPGQVFAYSDGRPQADLTAKNVHIRGEHLIYEALGGGELLRVKLRRETGNLYDSLAALAGAVAVGIPLGKAVERLTP